MSNTAANNSTPFFNAVDLLATTPLGSAGAGTDATIAAALASLSGDQRSALESGDWGRIQTLLKAENPQIDDPSGIDGLNPWNLFGVKVLAQRSNAPGPQ